MIRHRTLIAWTLAFAALDALIAVGVGSHPASYGEVRAEGVHFDLRIFHAHARKAFDGRVPYRDYVVEYPPLAFPLLAIPYAFSVDIPSYQNLFLAQMLLVNALVVYLVASRLASRSDDLRAMLSGLAWYSAFFVTLCPMVVARFDLVPAALGFLAACWWAAGRNALGGFAAAVGTLVKVAPGLVAGPGLVWELAQVRSSRGRGTLAFLATLGLGLALWAALAGPRFRDAFQFHLGRGVEVGSLYAGLIGLHGLLTGSPVRSVFDHSAFHVRSPWSDLAASWALPIQVAALLLVLWRSRRFGTREPLRSCAAMILAFILTGKVLSPQYLIWLLPFLAALDGPVASRARWLFLASCVATTALFPWYYWSLVRLRPSILLLLNARNLLLGVLLGVLLFGPSATDPQARSLRTGDAA